MGAAAQRELTGRWRRVLSTKTLLFSKEIIKLYCEGAKRASWCGSWGGEMGGEMGGEKALYHGTAKSQTRREATGGAFKRTISVILRCMLDFLLPSLSPGYLSSSCGGLLSIT
jgi:hypothetical protein